MSASGESVGHLFGDLSDDVRRALDAAEQAVERELSVSPGHYYRSTMIVGSYKPSVKMAYVIEVAVRAALEQSGREVPEADQ